MKPVKITRQQAEDQQHINAAYRHARRVLRELSRVRHMDGELARVQRGMYTVEDILKQYVATLDGTEIKEG